MVSPASGSSSETVTIYCASHPGLKTRTGTISFVSGEKTLTFNVTQTPNDADATPTGENAVAAEFNSTNACIIFTVTPFDAESNWTISVTAANGIGMSWPGRIIDEYDFEITPGQTVSKTYSGRMQLTGAFYGTLNGVVSVSYGVTFGDGSVKTGDIDCSVGV